MFLPNRILLLFNRYFWTDPYEFNLNKNNFVFKLKIHVVDLKVYILVYFFLNLTSKYFMRFF